MIKIRVKLTIRYPDGRVKVRIIESNDVKGNWKSFLLTGISGGSVHCARKIMIHDSAQGFSNIETGSLKAGTGDGTGPTLIKVTVHTNPSPTVTYSIDKVYLYDALLNEMAVATIAPPESFPPGAEMGVEYEGEFKDKSDVSHPAVATTYILYEFARAFGQDLDSETLDCGQFDGGTIKLYYKQGGIDQAPIEKTCSLVGVVDPTDTTNGMNILKAVGFYHATHDAATPTKVVLIPTDADEAHAYAEQTSGFTGAPFNLTTGTGITITYKTEVTEGP